MRIFIVAQYFPRLGKSHRLFSKPWKNLPENFQALEKVSMKFSNAWKTRCSDFQPLETRPAAHPSKPWK